jgi:hypothetical protein
MKNKKAQIQSFFLTLTTLLMCIIAIGSYAITAKNLQSSIISPVELMQQNQEERIFNIQEKELLLSITKDFDWEKNSLSNLKKKFEEELTKRTEIQNYLFENIDNDQIINNPSAFDTSQEKTLYIIKEIYDLSFDESTKELTLKRQNYKKRIDIAHPTHLKTTINYKITLDLENEITIEEKDLEFYQKVK